MRHPAMTPSIRWWRARRSTVQRLVCPLSRDNGRGLRKRDLPRLGSCTRGPGCWVGGVGLVEIVA